MRLGKLNIKMTPEDSGVRVVLSMDKIRFSMLVPSRMPSSTMYQIRAGASVVEDLLSATDKKTFVPSYMEGYEGEAAFKRAEQAKKLCMAAKRFGYDVLSEAVSEAMFQGLL